MKKSTTRRALLLSFASMFLCFTMLLGTTYAWFTDSVESDVNKIVAGNLDIELDYYDGTKWESVEAKKEIFDPEALWEPGYAEIVYLRVTNKGNLAFNFDFSLNVLEEIEGKDKEGKAFRLSEYLKYGVIEDATADQYANDRAGAIAAVDEARPFFEDGFGYADTSFTGYLEEQGDTKTFAIVIWMPTEVGNEANHNGVNVPEIHFGLNAFATQRSHEEDSFGDDYDANAFAPKSGAGMASYEPGMAGVNIQIRDKDNNKIGAIEIPATALNDRNAITNIEAEMKLNTESNPHGVTLGTDDGAFTYDIKVLNDLLNGIVAVKVMVRMDKFLDPATVKVHHYVESTGTLEEITNATYNPYTGYVTFHTTSFSPFTFVCEPESEYVAPDALPADLPVAKVTEKPEYVNTVLPWGSYGSWSPTEGLDSKLEAAYTFSCTETLEEAIDNPYAEWYCDFVVVLDEELGENEIFLGGNYGSFGWVGFHNGDLTLEANTEIPLLGSVTSNHWTYVDVVQNVSEFTCGVGDVNNALSGATFTVMLRLTNPENTDQFYNVATINYTFN